MSQLHGQVIYLETVPVHYLRSRSLRVQLILPKGRVTLHGNLIADFLYPMELWICHHENIWCLRQVTRKLRRRFTMFYVRGTLDLAVILMKRLLISWRGYLEFCLSSMILKFVYVCHWR
ncbi:E3 ubiquitin-protein ligase ORTHRUS [Trifolium repens]|nr:E3 ubiquitin-protein ligase ORTHRUS [Trifolium repens]